MAEIAAWARDARPGPAPRRCPADERGGRLGDRRPRLGAALRHGLRSASRRAWVRRSARRSPGSADADPRGPSAPQGARRRDAAGGRHRRRGPVRPGAPRRAAGRRPRPRPDPGPGGRGDRGPVASSRDRSRPTWSGSRSTRPSARPPRSPRGSRAGACSSRPSVPRSSGPAPTSTSRARTSSTPPTRSAGIAAMPASV